MKKKVLLSLVLGSIFISGCSCSVKDNPNIENNDKNDNAVTITDETIVAPQNINGIVLENTDFQIQNDVVTIITQYTNTLNSEFQLNNYQIIITDKDGMVLAYFVDDVNQTLAPNETNTSSVTFSTEVDMTKAVKVDYEINVETPNMDSENLPK